MCHPRKLDGRFVEQSLSTLREGKKMSMQHFNRYTEATSMKDMYRWNNNRNRITEEIVETKQIHF